MNPSEPLRSRPWLLYGAYGYTGRLLAREAVARGHRPVLAGRRKAPLGQLARELAGESGGATPLEVRVFSLDDPTVLREGLRGADAVVHAAGPFVHTAGPMLRACLEAGVHYLDITGEVPVFEEVLTLDGRARDAGIALMAGVGMDVVPTDGLAALLADHLPTATRLELALHSPGSPSDGTLRTILEHLPGGLLIRRDGQLERANPGRREFRRWIDMGPPPREGPMARVLGGRQSVAPYTWGDLATAYRTTGIGNVTCYMVTPRTTVRLLPVALPVLATVLAIGPLRRFAQARLAGGGRGPSAERRRTGRTRVWGRAEDPEGRAVEAVLELPQGHQFTAQAGVRALEEVLARTRPDGGDAVLSGSLTPAGAFGVDWVLSLPEVELIQGPTVTGPDRSTRRAS